MSPAAPPPLRTAPLALWRIARAFLVTLHMLFGAPEAVAARHTLTAKAHAHMLSWLRCAEAMMRRLLLIEASLYPKPNARPSSRPRQSRTRTLMEFRPAAPEKWRVSFRVFLGPPASRRPKAPAGARVSPRNKLRFRSAWPLAERYEALLRAFNDPALCARRLARRLHKLPHRFYAALHAPPEAHDRIERFDDLGAEACIAWRPHFSSA